MVFLTLLSFVTTKRRLLLFVFCVAFISYRSHVATVGVLFFLSVVDVYHRSDSVHVRQTQGLQFVISRKLSVQETWTSWIRILNSPLPISSSTL